MSGWRKASLGTICDEGGGTIRTGPFGSQLHDSDYSDVGTPVVMPKDIIDGRVSEATIARVPDEHVRRLSQHQLAVGDIVYGRRGDIGRRALITAVEAGWLCGTGCLRISPGSGVVEPRFLFYSLGHPKTIDAIAKKAVGATMPNLNTTILREVELLVPPLPTQRRIASILGAYDDLIEVNRRRIALLEEMARRLFEEWFVHFRFPGHEDVPIPNVGHTRLPDGWRAGVAAELVDFDPSTSLPRTGVKPFIPMASLDTRTSLIERIEEREVGSGARFQNGDTLFARITPCLENGKTGLVRDLPGDGVGFGSTEFIVMRGRVAGPAFTYLLARHDPFRAHAQRSMSGATGRQRVRTESVRMFKIAVPPHDLLARFETVTWPMLEMVGRLGAANRKLAASRDLLLPRLISGELPISVAERELEAAA